MDNQNNLPFEFIKRLELIVPLEKLEEIKRSFSIEKLLTFRINTLKTDRKTILDFLDSKNIKFELVSWYEDALIIDNSAKTQITESEIYKKGYIYFQNLSSMLPVVIMDPQPYEKILDIAAAPGSKTSQIAQFMKNSGEIVANDISRQRLFRLVSILKTQGITNVKIMQIPGEHIWRKYPNYFDKVLIDAPCSMEGRFRSYDPKTYADWSPKKIKVLSYLQKRILSSAFYSVKPGGIIVYSTCTLEPEENEAVIQYLLDKEKKHVKVMDTKIKYDSPLSIWKNKSFDRDIIKTMRVFPTHKMEGFFTSKIKRLS